jgi:acyl-CoA synthetase (AMP-forming)/AMP-acid ligase II
MIDDAIATALEWRSDLFGADPALVQGNAVLSWGGLEDQAARLAAFLDASGIKAGARVAVGMYNHPLYVVAVFAALKLHAVPVNVNHRYKAAELRHVLADSGAAVLVHDSALTAAFAEVAQDLPELVLEVHTEDAATAGSVAIATALSHGRLGRLGPEPGAEWLLYTGGTTGLPKSVVCSQPAILGNIRGLSGQVLGQPLPDQAAELERVLTGQQSVGAVIAARPGQEPAPEVLSARVSAKLADYKKPRHIVVVREIGRTASGKADLKWVRDVLSAALPERS